MSPRAQLVIKRMIFTVSESSSNFKNTLQYQKRRGAMETSTVGMSRQGISQKEYVDVRLKGLKEFVCLVTFLFAIFSTQMMLQNLLAGFFLPNYVAIHFFFSGRNSVSRHGIFLKYRRIPRRYKMSGEPRNTASFTLVDIHVHDFLLNWLSLLFHSLSVCKCVSVCGFASSYTLLCFIHSQVSVLGPNVLDSSCIVM